MSGISRPRRRRSAPVGGTDERRAAPYPHRHPRGGRPVHGLPWPGRDPRRRGARTLLRQRLRRERRPGVAPLPRQLAFLHRPRGRLTGPLGRAQDHQGQMERRHPALRRGRQRLPSLLDPGSDPDLHLRLRAHLWPDAAGARRARDLPRQSGLALPPVDVHSALRQPWPDDVVRVPDGLAGDEARLRRRAAPRHRGEEGPLRALGRRIRRTGHRCPDLPARPDVRRDVCHRLHLGGVRRDHGAAAPLVLEPARRLLLHGLLPGGPHPPRAHDDVRHPPPRRDRPREPQAAPRPGQALFRLHGVLGLPDVVAIPGDLVRQPSRGDRLRLRPALGPLAAGGSGGVPRDVRDPVHRPHRRGSQEVPPHAGDLHHSQPPGPLARALPAGPALGLHRRRPAGRAPRARPDPRASGALPGGVRALRPHLPDDLPAPRPHHPGARTGPRPRP